NLPGITVERLTLRRDDYRHLSGVHTRLILKERQATIAAVAIGQIELPAHIDATLSAGIIWLNELRNRGRRVNQLMIFLPSGCALPIACRLVYVHLEGVTIRLYEIDEEQRRLTPVVPFDQADLADKLQQASRRADWSQHLNKSLILKERLTQ